MIIAIDGPAGAGKSTVAKILAKKLGYLYLDTGAMYRALALKALEQNIPMSDKAALIAMAGQAKVDLVNTPDGPLKVLLDGRDVSEAIRQPRVTAVVSDVARIKEIRDIMLKEQRRLGNSTDTVLDGRDIGTVVFPRADKKFFLDAKFEERAERRFKELAHAKIAVTLPEVALDVQRRDTIDSTREVAPLKKADDALYIDSTSLSIDEVVELIVRSING